MNKIEENNKWLDPNFFVGDYRIVVLPDTQNIIERFPSLYLKMMKWIKDNYINLNIKAVLHMGDIVNTNTNEQWEIAKQGYDYINDTDIAFMPMLGNHDDPIMFNKYFDYQTYGVNKTYFGGSFETNKLDYCYWFIDIKETKYLVLSLGWAPSIEVIDWAKEVIENNKDKNIIFTTHAYMHRNNRLLQKDDQFSITSYPGLNNNLEGNEIWEIFSNYDNVVMGLSGHISSIELSKYTINNKTSLLFDNQDLDKIEQLGMIGILTFKKNSNKVGVNWFSSNLNLLYKEDNQFYINVNHINNGE